MAITETEKLSEANVWADRFDFIAFVESSCFNTCMCKFEFIAKS